MATADTAEATALIPLVYVDLALSPALVGGLSTANAIVLRPEKWPKPSIQKGGSLVPTKHQVGGIPMTSHDF